MTYGAAYENPPEINWRDLITRKALSIGGLALLAVTLAAIVSLATWHVGDPSLSHATDAPVSNLLGLPGAIFADLAMQFFGLAVIALLYPAVLTGWHMLRGRKPRSGLAQTFAALGGAWFPLDMTGEAFAAVGHLTPAAWAIDGLENIVVRGLGLESALLPAGIVLGYAVLFFAAAVWRFRFE